MSIRSSKMAVALLAGLAVLALARCGEGDDNTGDTGTVKKDGGPPAGPDASTAGQDAGPNGGTDAGRPDGSTVQTVETTVVAINNMDDANHPEEGSKVHFKGVVMSPMWRLSVSTSNTDPTRWNCLFGVYVADPTAGAEYNGLLVASKSTVDATTKKCNTDSPLHKVQATGGNFVVGEELEITGFYNEYCYKASGSNACQDQFDNKGISTPQISSNRDGDIVRTGQNPGAPTALPAVVTIDDIYSTIDANKAVTALGGKWWKYRTVLVKLENVKVTDPDSQPSNNWLIAPATAATPTLIVNDDVMFDNKDHAPAKDAVLTSLTGFVYWTFNTTQLSPRTTADSVPPMP